MADLQPIHFDLGNVDINIEPPTNLPSVADALLNNKPFPEDAFSTGAISLGSIKASASSDFKLDKVKFLKSASVGGGISAGMGVYRSTTNLFEMLKAEGLDEPMVTGLNFPDLANKNLLAIRWGYEASASISGSVALGPGISFGASGRISALYAVLRSLDRNTKSIAALTTAINSWKMPRQVDVPEKLEAGTWLISETDGKLDLSLGVEYGYDYSWVKEAVKIGSLSGDFGLKIEMGVKAAFGFSASGRYATVLCRESAAKKLRLQVFKMRQNGWSFNFDAAVSAQASTTVPDNFEQFIKGVFNLNGLQILKDFENVLNSKESLAAFFSGKFVDYAKEFLEKVTGVDNADEKFDEAIGMLRNLITRWKNLPHELTSLLYGFLSQAVPLGDFIDFLKRIIELANSETIKDEILSKLQEVDFFETPFGKWMAAIAGQGLLSFLANFDQAFEIIKTRAQQTIELLDGTTLANTLKKLQEWIEDKLGLDKVFDIINETDFATIDKWLKKRLSDFFGETIIFTELEKIKAAINALRAKAEKFYDLGLKAMTDKYSAEFHASFQKSTSKTALLDVEFDFDEHSENARKQLKNALNGNFSEILAIKIKGVKLNKGILTYEIKRNTHLEVKLPFFDRVRDHITESIVSGEVIDEENGRLWIFNLKAHDIVKKKSSLSKLQIAVELTKNAGVRQFSKESFRYDYTLLMAKRRADREYLESKLETLAREYFAAEFTDPNRQSFSTYLTALDKALDQKGIAGDNFFGNVLTSFNVSLSGRALGAWKNAPVDDEHPIYMAVSRAVQTALRRFIRLNYIQDLDQYKEIGAIYPLLVYSALPEMNKVKLTSGGLLKFTQDDLCWDITDMDLRRAIFNTFCEPKLRTDILPKIQGLLSQMPNTRGFYEESQIGNILRLNQPLATGNFNSLVFQENEIIRGIVKSGVKFRKFLDAQKIEEAIKELAEFGAKFTDAFNENISSIYKGDTLRPLGTLLVVKVAETLDPTLFNSIKPTALLDLYVLKPTTPFNPAVFFSGVRPTGEETALHQPILTIEKSNI